MNAKLKQYLFSEATNLYKNHQRGLQLCVMFCCFSKENKKKLSVLSVAFPIFIIFMQCLNIHCSMDYRTQIFNNVNL